MQNGLFDCGQDFIWDFDTSSPPFSGKASLLPSTTCQQNDERRVETLPVAFFIFHSGFSRLKFKKV
jgi:hypothetical protein